MSEAFLQTCPTARTSGLEVSEVDGEVLIYDGDALQAHCLNGPAARVWSLCDGTTSVATMVERLSAEGEAGAAEEVVRSALGQLSERDLLEVPVEDLDAKASTRRRLIKMGVAAIAVPVVTSIVAPTAAAAASAPAGSSNGTSSGSSSGVSGGGTGGSSS